MTLTLAIETSSINYGVVLCTPQEIVTCRTLRRDDPSFQGIGTLVSSALIAGDTEFKDLERLAVDVGPGNLGSVRAGVAYTNGLAFSLKRSIYCVDSLTLLAAEVTEASGGTILCLRDAGSGNVYIGLFRRGKRLHIGHGPMDSVVKSSARSLAEVSVAGAFRQDVKELLPDVVVKDTGVDFPTIQAMHRMLTESEIDIADCAPFASPLTDSSPVFNE